MMEIELKAWVADPAALIRRLGEWAVFTGLRLRDDTYWLDGRRNVQLRIRREKKLSADGAGSLTENWPVEKCSRSESDSGRRLEAVFGAMARRGADSPAAERVFATYKRKRLEASCEVNQEHEFQVAGAGGAAALEVFLQDAGFSPGLKKQKLVAAWEGEGANLELCCIPELGNFLELEILSASDGAAVVAEARKKLRRLLARCGIAEAAIEERYYSQLLAAARGRE